MRLLEGRAAEAAEAPGAAGDVNCGGAMGAMSTFNRAAALVKNSIENRILFAGVSSSAVVITPAKSPRTCECQ
jgi:hypothetical protein